MNKRKLGFALGSGGSRGVAHIGFLQAMEEAGIVPDFVTGCSMGAVVDGGVLERVPVKELKGMGAEKIVAVDVLGRQNLLKDSHSLMNVLTHTVGITDNYIVDQYKKKNKKIIDLWIEPDLGDMNQYAYKRGYAAGQHYAEKIKALIE